jgi:Predicted metal-dependent membrane protease
MKIKAFIKGIMWPILLGIGQFLIFCIIAALVMSIKQESLLKTKQWSNIEVTTKVNEYTKTKEFSKDIVKYSTKNIHILIIINSLIIIPLFTLKYKKINKKEQKIDKRKLMYLSVLSVLLALGINLLITVNIKTISKQTLLLIVSTSIIGPILEEVVFRGLLFKTLSKEFENKTAIIITVLVFTLFHGNSQNIIYILTMGFIFTYFYFKTNNILVPITMHILSNLAVATLLPYLHTLDLIGKIGIMLIFVFISIFICKRVVKNLEKKE